jgi:hypothetical protein
MLTLALPRRRTGCARRPRTGFCAALQRLRTYVLSRAVAALSRMGGCRSIMLRDRRRRRRWLGSCFLLTLALPMSKTGCSHDACTALCAALQRLRAYALSLARGRAVQDGLQPLHHAAGQKASEAVVRKLQVAYPAAAKEKDGVRPPRPHSPLC